ncbi:monoamine oxidase [Fodinibius sediminis]|uniref:Monoamine oxidase n=2 Tax=Fodinibius sediminis TaxID=1214077 RepID=A0A521EM14_9BACT|nr:monoamine oxidase [Fodinibius sediminis]
MKTTDVLIIGAGLSGLATAYYLQKEGLDTTIIEARNRLGGRIHTLRNEGEPPIEMGATWLGRKHRHLTALLKELDIGIYEQYMGDRGFYEPMSTSPPQLVTLPPNEEPSYRIDGGSGRLVQSLADHLAQGTIITGETVQSIRKDDNQLLAETGSNSYRADIIVSTLPPKLLSTLKFTPSLPDPLRNTASRTHTWMAESIKVALTFDEPFWRQPTSSGTIFSNVGPVDEMYDHSSDSQNCFALKGFMDGAFHSVSREDRKKRLLEQLNRFYGDKADDYNAYHETVWREEPHTYAAYDEPVIPHQLNGSPVFQEPIFNGRLILAGSETATAFPGYMDGAVESAQTAVGRLRPMLP